MFEEYFELELQSHPAYTTKTKTTQESYRGILKKEFPKWEGWKVIKREKEEGTHISNISNEKLDTLVYNFYYIKYIESKFT